MSEKLISMIKEHEGKKLKPYKCSEGYLTIGWGRNLDSNGISEEEAEQMLKNDIWDAQMDCIRNIKVWGSLDVVRQSVLIDMCFNMGISKLLKFKKTLNDINNKNYKAASLEMLDSKWAKQVGKRAKKLSEMMKTGSW
jgi:lysozyme